jgi:protein arginine kinase
MISPDFESDAGGRALLLDSDRSISVMVNEEDHLRVQAITPGWSIDRASQLSTQCLAEIQDNSVFAWNETFGYLTASPFNAGFGRRMSAMFHLIGLAQAKRLPSVLRALASQGLTARGLFGESSRATGAFVQISVVGASTSDFVGACDYLLHEERDARDAVDDTALADKTDRALHFAMRSKTVTLADALRVLAWVRWASVRNLSAYALPGRQVDHYLTILELRSGKDDERSARHRAEFLRSSLQNLAAV